MKIQIEHLPIPLLEFGQGERHTDPRQGLLVGGPYSMQFGTGHKTQVQVGLVGLQEDIQAGIEWFTRCQSTIPPKSNHIMYVGFPGFENVFRSKLDFGTRSAVAIDRELREALDQSVPSARFQATVDVYLKAIDRLRERTLPDVVVCCIPPEVVQKCWSIKRALTPQEKKILKKEAEEENSLQLNLFRAWEVEETAEDLLQRDFRRALKAGSMKLKVPIQLAVSLFRDSDANQDAATRAWNSSVGIFYKAGGMPWRLCLDGPDTCFVGISFHHRKTSQRSWIYSSLAQAFSSDGDGFALRGEAATRDFNGRNIPYLSRSQSIQLGSKVLEEYRDRTGRRPARIVFHKTSAFDDEELTGFKQALIDTPLLEFVTLRESDFRLLQRGAYPPKRGTLCRINDSRNILYATGYIDDWQTYPGLHVPAPIDIVLPDSIQIRKVATEILGLARMNWNTAFDTGGTPVTLSFARRVGGIMNELGTSSSPDPSYRYYI